MSLEEKFNFSLEPEEKETQKNEEYYENYESFSEYILMYDPNRVLALGYKNKGSIMTKILSEKLGELNYSVKRILENIPIIVYSIPESEEVMFNKKLDELKEEGIISSYERGGKFYILKEQKR